MTRTPPPADWVVYVVVLSVVAAMMYGKYLIGKGDEPIQDVLKEDIEELEHVIEDIVEDVEKKIK
jgi:hypothetical protein